MPGELQNSKRTKHHTVDPWKGLVPSPRYSGERVRVRGSSIASIADGGCICRMGPISKKEPKTTR